MSSYPPPESISRSFMYYTNLCIPQQIGFKLSQHLLTISRWKDSDFQKLLETRNKEVGTENTWSLSHLVSTCFEAAIYSSKSWWWQPITISSTGVTVLPIAVQKYGCTKQLISQTVEKVQIVDQEEEKEGKEWHRWSLVWEKGIGNPRQGDNITSCRFYAWILKKSIREQNCEGRLAEIQQGKDSVQGTCRQKRRKRQNKEQRLLGVSGPFATQLTECVTLSLLLVLRLLPVLM